MINDSPINAIPIASAAPPEAVDECVTKIVGAPGSVPNASPINSWALNAGGRRGITDCGPPPAAGKVFDPLERVEIYLLDVGDVRVPMSSFQATMRLEGESFVQAVIPGFDSPAGLDHGARMKIKLGYYYPDTDEYSDLETIAEAPLGEITISEGATRKTATLSGYGRRPLYEYRSRTLTGVQTRTTQKGLRRVRCEIDLLLRPGNVAIDEDGAEFGVKDIQYFVNASSAAMEVTENGQS